MKKYIRTDRFIMKSKDWMNKVGNEIIIDGVTFPFVAEADTIDELIDELIIYNPNNDGKNYPKRFVYQGDWKDMLNEKTAKFHINEYEEKVEVYGAIWTNGPHGEPILLSAAKMNEEGKLETIYEYDDIIGNLIQTSGIRNDDNGRMTINRYTKMSNVYPWEPYTCKHPVPAIAKLGTLENYEERIGISLYVILHVLTSEKIYARGPNGCPYIAYCDVCKVDFKERKICYKYVFPDSFVHKYVHNFTFMEVEFKDFGVTWSDIGGILK